ncbi:hypothetical protein DWW75_06805 [Ruminococcus sp. AF17-11]|nr:hypothetical protein [Ruminococcus sp. AF17-11]RGG86178.1 hypothetical protein DWW75_06805 [Ruminococcus sp. AF17-11]
MELKEKITLNMLTKDSVSVLRQQFLTFNGEEMQVGGNIRNAYMNDESGREQIRKVLSDEYYNAVMAVWGTEPTVEEPTESESENNAD